MICASRPVPSVVTTSAWVSPRVKIAEPWVRGSTPTWTSILRTVLRVAAVDARLAGDDAAAHDVLLDVVERGLRPASASSCRLRRPFAGDALLLELADLGVAGLLLGDAVGLGDLRDELGDAPCRALRPRPAAPSS